MYGIYVINLLYFSQNKFVINGVKKHNNSISHNGKKDL